MQTVKTTRASTTVRKKYFGLGEKKSGYDAGINAGMTNDLCLLHLDVSFSASLHAYRLNETFVSCS